MSETIRQLALSLETHRNHFLFSDYCLNELLPRQAMWRAAEAEVRRTLEAITHLYDQKAGLLPHYNESQTEQHWIRPVLDILGHVYEVQPPLPGALGTPDYAFFATEEGRQAAAPMLGQAAYWGSALAVGDAKRWDRSLDKRILNGAPDAFTNANPCYQIDYYLRRTHLPWGIVSNGRRWRLYHRDSSFRLDVFYEVDLVQLIEQGDRSAEHSRRSLDAFCYFYFFFRAAAFYPDAEGRCWLDEVLAQSTAYAVRVGDELEGRVYEALRLLAQGFLDYPVGANPRGRPLDPSTDLSRVHDGCLILLYRLLFLLYAESRGLLPLDNPSYAGQYSLKAIKEDIAHKLDTGVVYLAQKATIWDNLRTLFDIIYGGQETLGVPTYDGRLFDPARYPFLEEHTIGDRYLAQAIDLLARAEAGPAGARAPRPHSSFVDYRDLSIRHLGSIYEGLLEYKLAYAAEEMAVVKRGKKEEIVPASEMEKPGFFRKTRFLERFPAGQVYLVTDRGERKATGSYYTPDYIVKYIVEQTLRPLADAQAEAVEGEIAALNARNKGGARGTQAYKDELARLQNSFAGRVLALNVLDPAMGSGHFLVEATDYLARRIVEAGVVTEALANGDEESEPSYWRRRVVERCIYGVDLNPLAVELAKLSLWLATVAKGKPLSFLDHHLRCGNSLIGARVADLQVLPVRKKRRRKKTEVSQMALWDEGAFTQDMYRVVGAMRQIGEYETADLVSVKEKERLFEETVERERLKWRRVADLWTATYFGLELAPEMYNACMQYAQGREVLLRAAQAEALLAQAHEMWEEKRFFHWEIEFPEVFFDEYGRHKGETAGFDAVVGNPPYVSFGLGRTTKLSRFEEQFYRAGFERSAEYKISIYALFMEQGLAKCRVGGYESLIVPDSFLNGMYFSKIREYLLQGSTLRYVVVFDHDFWKSGDVGFPTIFVTRKLAKNQSPVEGNPHFLYTRATEPKDLFSDHIEYMKQSQNAQLENPRMRFQLLSGDSKELIKKMGKDGSPLGTLLSMHHGIRSRIGRDKIIAKVRLGPNWKRAIVSSGEIHRHSISPECHFVHIDLNLLFSGGWNPDHIEQDKILIRRTGDSLICVVDVNGFYHTNALIYGVPTAQAEKWSLFALSSILNSRLVNFYYQRTTLKTGRTLPQVEIDTLRHLPVPRIPFTTPAEERERLVGDGITEATEWIESTERGSVDSVSFSAFSDSKPGRWLDVRLLAEPEQSDVVHDLLAHLAERMIEMHKEKQAEVRGFLDWLVNYTGRPVDEWALKTHLRRYYEHNWAEMQRVLKRNQRKLPGVRLDVEAYKNAPTAKIRAAWETSMETLRPLLARIAATDQLIDLIVYRLYGLTEKEVGVVER